MGRTSNSKERMLIAARDLIWKQGYCSVTIDAICQEAGVRKGSFYYFFDSKPELAAAAFKALWEELKAQLDEIFSAGVPPLERLRAYFRFVLAMQVSLEQKYGRVVGCPFGSVGSELSQREELVCKNARANLGSYRKYFEIALRDATAEGSVNLKNIPSAAQRLSAYMEGCLLQARVQNSLNPLRDLASSALELIGVRTDSMPLTKRAFVAGNSNAFVGSRF
ncbi:MAG: TetR family transcriptional regulator [Pedosphaera sp.]|nr:TetR family transcriptional regulator [Pedosphaera sp.]